MLMANKGGRDDANRKWLAMMAVAVPLPRGTALARMTGFASAEA